MKDREGVHVAEIGSEQKKDGLLDDRVYRVFYCKQPTFFEDSALTRKQVLEETHRLLMSVCATDLEDLFFKCQGEQWSPNGEYRELIKAKGLSHTSMSVGDCALDTETDKLYEVATRGWRRIKDGDNSG